jgi:hypothetical protein
MSWRLWLDRWQRRRTRRRLQQLGDTSIVTVFGAGPIAEAIAHAQRAAAVDKGVLVIGVLPDPRARTWHVCLSRSGRDMTWVAQHPSYEQAQAQVAWITYMAQQNDLGDDVAFTALTEELKSWDVSQS